MSDKVQLSELKVGDNFILNNEIFTKMSTNVHISGQGIAKHICNFGTGKAVRGVLSVNTLVTKYTAK